MKSEAEEFLGITDPCQETSKSAESDLRALRVVVSFLVGLPVALSILPLVVLGALGQADPMHSPKEGSGFLGFAYSIILIGLTFTSIWTPSRPLLIAATVLWIPFAAYCVIVGTLIPFLWFLIIPPILWVIFFFIAWPRYRNGKPTAGTDSEIQKEQTPFENTNQAN